LDQALALEDYSVSNRGLRSGLVGTPESVAEQVAAFEAAGVDLLLLQCSPQYEEMERFSEAVIQSAPQPQRRWKQKPLRVRSKGKAKLMGMIKTSLG